MLLTDESVTAPLHRALQVKAFGITDKGRVRPTNEDQFLSADSPDSPERAPWDGVAVAVILPKATLEPRK